jgi:hypothetical protein
MLEVVRSGPRWLAQIIVGEEPAESDFPSPDLLRDLRESDIVQRYADAVLVPIERLFPPPPPAYGIDVSRVVPVLRRIGAERLETLRRLRDALLSGDTEEVLAQARVITGLGDGR